MQTLKDNLELRKRLLGYSAVASLAATGGLVTAVPQAAATGISRDINCVMDAAGEFCDIDFDNDGNPEFQLFLSSSFASDLWMQTRSGGGDAGGSHVYSGGNAAYAAVLPFGSNLSTGRADWSNATTSWSNSGTVLWTSFDSGNWGAPKGDEADSTQGAFVGVSFQLDGGGTHYGWIELYIPANGDVTVKRIGYDDVVGGSIPTAVHLSEFGASSSPWPAAGAVVLTAVAGVLTWLRLRLGKTQ